MPKFNATATEPTLSDRQGFNRRWYANNDDLVIYRPTTADEVQEIFQSLIEEQNNNGLNGFQVQITCGRHCYENFVYNQFTTHIIDMTGLRGYSITGSNSASVDVGFSNWAMYRTLNNVGGITLPAGSCYSVGLGGHITGGGYGLLSRLYGLTIDLLSGVDIVIQTDQSTAKLITCTPDNEYSDLFWGIQGGGGGQFGIITRYYFDNIPEAPESMFSFNLTWDWNNSDGTLAIDEATFNSIVDLFQETFLMQEENYWNTWAMLHLNHRDAGNISIPAFVYYVPSLHGDRAKFESDLTKRIKKWVKEAEKIAPLSNGDYTLYGHPHIPSTKAMNAVGLNSDTNQRHYTYLEGTQQFNASGSNQFGKYKSAYMRKNWTDTMLQAAYSYLTTPVYDYNDSSVLLDMSQSLIQVDSYGGKINDVTSNATAIPQRDSIMKLQYQTYWDSDAEIGSDDTGMAIAQCNWLKEMYTAIYADTGGFPDPSLDSTDNVDGCYYNYPDLDLGYNGSPDKPLSFALDLYFGNNLATLQTVKNKYNSNGWFLNQQSVYPDGLQVT